MVEISQIEKLREQGLLGSVEDSKWNGKMHECCGSTRSYYHRAGCPLCVGKLEEVKNSVEKNGAGNIVRFNKHRNRKNHDLVAAMYAMYKMGPEGKPCSLEQIGKVYRKSRQAIFELFKTRGYEMRSKPAPVRFVVMDGRKFTPRHDGYWRATSGDRKQLHVWVWEKSNGKLLAGHGIHHRDLDRANNSIENLECLTIQEISSKYNPHLNQFSSPTGSRKWKRGRIIPRIKGNDEANFRAAKGRGDIYPRALLCDLPEDSDI